MCAVQVRVWYKNVYYTSNLVGPKAHKLFTLTAPLKLMVDVRPA